MIAWVLWTVIEKDLRKDLSKAQHFVLSKEIVFDLSMVLVTTVLVQSLPMLVLPMEREKASTMVYSTEWTMVIV